MNGDNIDTSIKRNERTSISSFVFCLLALVAGDWLIKYFIPKSEFFFNGNFAFSLPLPVWLMYGIYFFVISAIAVYLLKKFSQMDKREKFAWTFILAGAASNVGERLVLGYVRDYIHIFNGVFNLADGYILGGIALLLTRMTRLSKIEQD